MGLSWEIWGGNTSAQFTETEDDEEWVGWVDWGALGGGSGSV